MKNRLSFPIALILIIVALPGLRLNAQVNSSNGNSKFKTITRELACQCGCGLLVSACDPNDCATSKEIRANVTALINQGKSEPEILHSMVATYGEQILAAPPKEGFSLSAYILPFAFLIIGGYVLMLIITRWLPKIRGTETETMISASGNGNGTSETGIRHKQQIEQELKDLDL